MAGRQMLRLLVVGGMAVFLVACTGVEVGKDEVATSAAVPFSTSSVAADRSGPVQTDPLVKTESYEKFGVTVMVPEGFEIINEPSEATVVGGVLIMESAPTEKVYVIGINWLARTNRVLYDTLEDLQNQGLASELENPDIEVGEPRAAQFRGEPALIRSITSFGGKGLSGLNLTWRTDSCSNDFGFFILGMVDDPSDLESTLLDYLKSFECLRPSNAPIGYQTVGGDHLGFTVLLPDTWAVIDTTADNVEAMAESVRSNLGLDFSYPRPGRNPSIVAVEPSRPEPFGSPGDASEVATVFVTPRESGEDLDQIVTQVLQVHRGSGHLVTDVESVSLPSGPAVRIAYEQPYESPNEDTLIAYATDYILVGPDNWYLIGMSASQPGESTGIIDNMAESFSLER